MFKKYSILLMFEWHYKNNKNLESEYIMVRMFQAYLFLKNSSIEIFGRWKYFEILPSRSLPSNVPEGPRLFLTFGHTMDASD